MADRHDAEAFLRGFAHGHPGVRLGGVFGHLAAFAGHRVFARVVNARLLCRHQHYPDVSCSRWTAVSTADTVDRLAAVAALEQSVAATAALLENTERSQVDWSGLP